MEKQEFIVKARQMGLAEEYIQETIALHEDAEAAGVRMLYEVDLIEPPTVYPATTTQ